MRVLSLAIRPGVRYPISAVSHVANCATSDSMGSYGSIFVKDKTLMRVANAYGCFIARSSCLGSRNHAGATPLWRCGAALA